MVAIAYLYLSVVGRKGSLEVRDSGSGEVLATDESVSKELALILESMDRRPPPSGQPPFSPAEEKPGMMMPPAKEPPPETAPPTKKKSQVEEIQAAAAEARRKQAEHDAAERDKAAAAAERAEKARLAKKHEQDEERARSNLRFAKNLIEEGKGAQARERLLKIIDDLPDTKAAEEARELLKKIE